MLMQKLFVVCWGDGWELLWPIDAWQTLTPEEQTAVAARQRDLLATGNGKAKTQENENETVSRYSHINI